MSTIVAGAFNVAIYCVIVILVAVIIVWIAKLCGYTIEGDVYKWGRILVILLCAAAIVLWLLSLIGVAVYPGPHFLR